MIKQWQNELLDKFSIPGVIVDGLEYKISKKDAYNPFDCNNLTVIVSIPFAFLKELNTNEY
ncbi:helicase subunit of dna repair complex [Candidatus Brocadia pituitae]|nr:helicase subunit of dna repair complex [Candidatus Brocadia pituitae]